MNYTVTRSKRRTLSLEIVSGGKVQIKAPLLMSEKEIENFARKHSGWIEEKLALQEKRDASALLISERKEELTAKARKIIPPLVAKYSSLMRLYPTSVKITSAEKRFGSCSGKNALCFSWRLLAFPENAVEYVVVHELAHIKHHNHGKRFYSLIEKYMPDYRERQKLLKTQL